MINIRRYKESVSVMDEFRVDSSAIRIYADASRDNMYLEDPSNGPISLSNLATTETANA